MRCCEVFEQKIGNSWTLAALVVKVPEYRDLRTQNRMYQERWWLFFTNHVVKWLDAEKGPPNKLQLWKEKIHARWFKVTFSSPSWRALNPLKGSLNHPKKVTLNHQVFFVYHGFFFLTQLIMEQLQASNFRNLFLLDDFKRLLFRRWLGQTVWPANKETKFVNTFQTLKNTTCFFPSSFFFQFSRLKTPIPQYYPILSNTPTLPRNHGEKQTIIST